jgi:hypothetical protein
MSITGVLPTVVGEDIDAVRAAFAVTSGSIRSGGAASLRPLFLWLPGQVLLGTATTGAVPSIFTGILECDLLVHNTMLFFQYVEGYLLFIYRKE